MRPEDTLTDLEMIGRRVLYGHVQLDITTPGVRAHLGISGTVGASNQGTEKQYLSFSVYNTESV